MNELSCKTAAVTVNQWIAAAIMDKKEIEVSLRRPIGNL
jgi:hypothetical protein